MPTPRRYPERTLTARERAALSRQRRAAEQARMVAALRRILIADTIADARRIAAEALHPTDSTPAAIPLRGTTED